MQFIKFVLVITLLSNSLFAQNNPKKEKEQAQMEQMMIQAMKQQGMSQTEIDEALKEYRAMQPVIDEMKDSGVMGSSDETNLSIPAKQTKLLSGLPILTKASTPQYIANLSKEANAKIASQIKIQADKIWAENNQDKNTSMLLFLKGELKSAVYISLKTAEKYPDDDLVLNNLAFVLAQTGYPQKALPIQLQLYNQYQNDITANNLGQSFLALGDVENAKKYFTFGLAVNPQHFEMNCAMGLIEAEKGVPIKAQVYIKKALQKGYSPIAEALAKKTNLKLSYNDIYKTEVPEYFNAYKLKPVAATEDWLAIPQVLAEREALTELHRQWYQKREEATAIADTQDLSKMYKEHMGIVQGPFAKKALFMIKLIGEDQMEQLSTKKMLLPYYEKETELRKAFDNKIDNMYQNKSYDNAAEECKTKVQFLKEYLSASKQNRDAAERSLLPKYYDWINQSLYWNAFLQSGDAYQTTYVGYVHDFIGRLLTFDDFQNLYPTPEYISVHCKDYEQDLQKIKAAELADDSPNCPVNFKFKTALADLKFNCKGYEVEGGELAKLSFEKDIKTGEFQIAFGLGVDADAGFLAFGAKGMMYMRFGSDFTPVDMGGLAEAGVEAQVGTFNVEEKLKGTMGIGSVNVEAIHHGEEIKIFSADATKDTRDDAAAIKPLEK
jgi:hypothetical protein